MGYEAFILLPHASFTLQDARALLEARFAGRAEVRVRAGGRLELKTNDGWWVRVALNTEAHVLEESAEIAATLAGGECSANAPEVLERARQVRLETFPTRFELTSKADPNMDHFNDYLFAVEALQALEGTVAFDPSTMMFM